MKFPDFQIDAYDIAYILIAIGCTSVSFFVTEENDFILRISTNIIVILLPILVLYGTMSTNLIREMIDLQIKYPSLLGDVHSIERYNTTIKEIRTCFNHEIIFIALSVFTLIVRGLIKSQPNLTDYGNLSRLFVDFMIVLSVVYFFDVVRQTIMALFDMFKLKNEALSLGR